MRVGTILKPENFLRIPFKLLYELGVNQVVHYPTPQRAVPGLVCFFTPLELADNFLTFELGTEGVQTILILGNSLKYKYIHISEQLGSVGQCSV